MLKSNGSGKYAIPSYRQAGRRCVGGPGRGSWWAGRWTFPLCGRSRAWRSCGPAGSDPAAAHTSSSAAAAGERSSLSVEKNNFKLVLGPDRIRNLFRILKGIVSGERNFFNELPVFNEIMCLCAANGL
jgi:hypothetical protein